MNARRVGIFRLQLFKPSEGFIESQAQQLRRWQPIYVGRRRFGIGPERAQVAMPSARRAAGRAIDLLRVSVMRQGGPFMRALPAPPPALIHAHFAVDAVFAQPVARALGVPLLTTLHGFDVTRSSWDMLRSGRPNLINAVARRAELQREGALFLCVSEFIRQAALARGFPAERLRVHYIGIDCSRIEPRRHAGEDGLIVHVARLVEKKGTTYLLQALARLRRQVPEARLVIIGDGPLRPSLEAEARALGIADAVQFLGVLGNAEVLQWISRAAVKVVPSVTGPDGDMEGFGIVNLEAGAQGVPVVGSRSGGIVEAIHDGYSGLLCDERDVDGLARQITRLLADRPLRERIGQQARRFVEARFDLRRQTALLEDVYDELVGA